MLYSAFSLNIAEEPNIGFKNSQELHRIRKETNSPKNSHDSDPNFLTAADYEAKVLASQGLLVDKDV